MFVNPDNNERLLARKNAWHLYSFTHLGGVARYLPTVSVVLWIGVACLNCHPSRFWRRTSGESIGLDRIQLASERGPAGKAIRMYEIPKIFPEVLRQKQLR
jgi:hypothetical protein